MDESITGPELPPPESLPDIPQKIGRYKIEGLLEKGGMSLLYLGMHPELEEPIIVKVLSPKYLSHPDVIARFLNEAEIISLTDHPNIIKLYDYGSWENGLYIAMEFVRGTSLRKILTHQPFSLKRALDVLLQTSYALCHLHTHGVIHRDLKPENILITDEGAIKVIDFGISQMLAHKKEGEASNEAGKLIGTPIYMSPEARENPEQITFQSDIYSLGILAYELVLGKITHGRVVLSLAPKGMQKILTKALQPRPEDRYQDIVDFITDLSHYIASVDVEKDRQGADYFFELFDHMEQFQEKLLPDTAPDWPEADIGFAHSITIGSNCAYYDFFDFGKGKKKGIFVAEAQSAGAVGVVQSAMLRVLVRTLAQSQDDQDEKTFFHKLQERIKKDFFGEEFRFLCLLLDFDKMCYDYSTHDSYGAILPPGEGKHGLLTNERLTLFGIGLEESLKDELIQMKKETDALVSQKQCDALIRKMRLKSEFSSEEHPLIIISIQPKI